jgi:hypothetical protein
LCLFLVFIDIQEAKSTPLQGEGAISGYPGASYPPIMSGPPSGFNPQAAQQYLGWINQSLASGVMPSLADLAQGFRSVSSDAEAPESKYLTGQITRIFSLYDSDQSTNSSPVSTRLAQFLYVHANDKLDQIQGTLSNLLTNLDPNSWQAANITSRMQQLETQVRQGTLGQAWRDLPPDPYRGEAFRLPPSQPMFYPMNAMG